MRAIGHAAVVALGIACLLASDAVLACSPAPVGIREARRADVVFVGEATRLQRVKPTFDLFVHVAPTETLKGKPMPDTRARSPCGAPIGMGQRVVVASWRGVFYVYPAAEYEERFRKAFPSGR